MSSTTKPKGILYIAILYIIVVVAGIVVAILSFMPSATGGVNMMEDLWNQIVLGIPIVGDNIDNLLHSILFENATIWAVIVIVLAVIVLVDVILLFKMSPTGRNLAMVIALPLIVVLLGLIILWYLFKDEVKNTFTKASMASGTK